MDTKLCFLPWHCRQVVEGGVQVTGAAVLVLVVTVDLVRGGGEAVLVFEVLHSLI